ncbi:hypothetical protein BT93_I0845 [Corymbia citriodora subsp. variegata]|nr:hypothetical protein BT93_I0845 [Corymbia citriodora subsp. variegata]
MEPEAPEQSLPRAVQRYFCRSQQLIRSTVVRAY